MRCYFRLCKSVINNIVNQTHSSRTAAEHKKKKLINLLLAMPKPEPGVMPKDKPHIQPLQAVRRLKKFDMLKYNPGTIQLQVLGNSLYLFTDQSRYLFNCAEGTQRLAHEHRQRLAKVEHVFLTSGRWERVGGLCGVALTIQDIGVERIFVHGPPGANRLFKTARRFVILKDLDVTFINTLRPSSDAEPSDFYEDHILKIKYINVMQQQQESVTNTKNDSVPSSEDETDQTDYYSAYRKRHGENMISVSGDDEDAATVQGKHVAISYACHLKKKEGQLLIDRCIEKGVPPGPLLGKLKAGEDVVLKDGTVVKADDVRAGACPGPIILVVDCPTVDHLNNFVSHPTFEPYKTDPFTQVIVHFTPLDVVGTPEYMAFMKSFGIKDKQPVQHMFINEEVLSDAHEGVHRMQTKLNMIDDTIFPMFPTKKLPSLDYNLDNIVIGETGLKIGIRPNAMMERPTWKIDTAAYKEEMLANEEFMTRLEKYKAKTEGHKVRDSDSKLVFLGTGSSIPNKTRNVSSFLLQIDEKNCMLFDCGEGTLSQLMRLPNAAHFLSTLKCIYISHLHADHHLGLFSFLKLKKLAVIAPKQIASWISSYSKDFETLHYELLPCDLFLEKKSGENYEGQSVQAQLANEVITKFGLSSLRTCFVKHCPNSFGVSVVLDGGKKITYSGDTMPTDNLVELGRDSDVLVHEATMEDGLENEAVLKMHSTVSQAVEIGQKMGAKFTILTHFSQRYSKLPLIREELQSNVGVAFDNLHVPLDQLSLLGGMMPVLEAGWAEHVEEMSDKMVKRTKREHLVQELTATETATATAV